MERVVPTELDTVMSQNNERGKRQRETQRERQGNRECVRQRNVQRPRERQEDGKLMDRELRLTMREKETARG